MLLRAGAQVDAPAANNATALHQAIPGGHLPVMQVLIAAGANIQAAAGVEAAPLHLAA